MAIKRRKWLGLLGVMPLFVGVSLAAATDRIAGDPAYLRQLQRAAERQELASEPQWRYLLHAPRHSAGAVSRADDRDFFFAAHGSSDPEAELRATLRAFFRPATKHQPVRPQGDRARQHPQCAFPARYQWLRQRLNFNPERMPERSCPYFEWWRDQINAAGATLVFPTAYMNNPSSMYGHTLLRLDKPQQTPETRLAAYTVNYAADPGNDNGLFFAIKGLIGSYPGTFSITPYYEKINLYNDMESRDIWEYRLDLSPDEVGRLVRHIWELRGIRFDYYFLNENCSSQLLALLEVARPSLRLSERFPLWAIPADTVRAVRDVGLIRDTSYRPALGTRVTDRARRLSLDLRQLARRLARGERAVEHINLDAWEGQERARLLDLAYLYLRYLRQNGVVERDTAAKRGQDLLKARARAPSTGFAEPVPQPAVRPDQGHGSARVALGGGSHRGRGFQSLRFRPAYHDILDPTGGYVDGAQINFGDFSLRRYDAQQGSKGQYELESLELIDIVSLAPQGTFRSALSWRVRTGAERYPLHPDGGVDRRPLAWRTYGGPGLAWEVGGWLRPYAFLEVSADVASALVKGWAVGGGARLGVWLDPLPSWRVGLEGRAMRFSGGQRFSRHGAVLRSRVTLGRNHAFQLKVGAHEAFGEPWSTGELAWHAYF